MRFIAVVEAVGRVRNPRECGGAGCARGWGHPGGMSQGAVGSARRDVTNEVARSRCPQPPAAAPRSTACRGPTGQPLRMAASRRRFDRPQFPDFSGHLFRTPHHGRIAAAVADLDPRGSAEFDAPCAALATSNDFVVDLSGHDNAAEHDGQEIKGPSRSEMDDRTGVGDDDHRIGRSSAASSSGSKSWEQDETGIRREANLDGIYVVRTSEPS